MIRQYASAALPEGHVQYGISFQISLHESNTGVLKSNKWRSGSLSDDFNELKIILQLASIRFEKPSKFADLVL